MSNSRGETEKQSGSLVTRIPPKFGVAKTTTGTHNRPLVCLQYKHWYGADYVKQGVTHTFRCNISCSSLIQLNLIRITQQPLQPSELLRITVIVA